MKIGIIKERKVPIDRRVPITPDQAAELMEDRPDIQIVCESSDIRCYADEEYHNAGIPVVDNISDCDVLFGVKEVPIASLIPEKTYFFFSHTIKEQEYNRGLLQAILEKNIRLIDYETLTAPNGQRVVAFGRYAGIVGAYNGLHTFGERYNLFHLKRAHECFDLTELKLELNKVVLPPMKIALTGGGRVAKGAMEILNAVPIRKVSPARFLDEDFAEPVYVQLNARDYYTPRDGGEFVRDEFFQHPERYVSTFLQFAEKSDMLIAGAYWDPRSDVLFHRSDIMEPGFMIRVIADITCDIEGSIPSTKQPSTIDDPVYDYDPTGDSVRAAYSDEGNITVMAVDNLPCELPRDASNDFGHEILNHVLPALLGNDEEEIIARATLTQNGGLTERYSYLQGYVNGK